MKFIRKLLAICSVFIFLAGVFVPNEASGITIEQEKEMGREFMKAVLKQVELIEDPLIVNYVNKIGQKIVSVLPDPPYKYHFYVIKEDAYNAFAAPAGHIFINSGLIAAMENEEELAGILGHEIVHVHCRHLSQRIEKSSKINMLTLAGIAAGIFLGAGGSGEAADAVIVSAMAAGQSIALAYSRENEMQADQIGLKYLSEAGYTCAGLLTMLKKIRSKSWFGSQQIPTYLTTHPASEDRIVYISAWIAANQKTASQTSNQASKKGAYDFEIVHTKLIAMYGEESAALRRFETQVGKYPENPMAHYAYGLVLARSGNSKDAINHLKIALEKKAFDPYILTDLGKMYYLDNRYEEAIRMLENSFDTGINDPEAQLFLGCAQLKADKLEEATSTFKKLLKEKPVSSQFEQRERGKKEKKPDQVDNEEYNKGPQYNQVLYYLGEVYHKKGQPGDAHFYLGWYFMTKKEFENAKFHLSKALESIEDPDKRKEIQKMLKAIYTMPRRQKNIDK